MISDKLFKEVDKLNLPINARMAIKVYVDITPSRLIYKLADITRSELYRMANQAKAKELDQLDEDSILNYYKTLVYLRVLHVNGGLRGEMSKWNSFYKVAAVPSFLYQILISIGTCRDTDYNLVFIPSYSIEGKDLLPLEEALAISEELTSFDSLSQVFGLPNDPNGELAFMAMQHVDGEVTSYRRDHPVYAFLAAFIEQQQFNEITGSLSRVLYGTVSDYEVLMTGLMRKFLNRSEK